MKWQLLCVCLVGCTSQEEPATSITFSEIDSVFESTHCGNEISQTILDVNGTGLGLFDFDHDDDLDLFVANAQEPCRLYENISDGNIRFKDASDRLGNQQFGHAIGVAIGDANGDGFDDIYLTCYGKNRLLMNKEGVSFKDVTDQSGVGDEQWGTSARFGDLDGDGDQDLYVCNYLHFRKDSPPPKARYKGEVVFGGPHGMRPQRDVVFENLGDGTFADVTKKWGFEGQPAFSLNAAILDFNGDGYQDVFVGNDSMANDLYLNDGNQPPSFSNVGMQSGVSANGDGSMQATMGIGIVDVDGNGRPDIFTTNFSSDTNTLHLNQPSGFFDDLTKRHGLGLPSRTLLGWTCGFHDFDTDGDEDLYIVNGHVYPNATMHSMDSEHKQQPLLFERRGDRFVLIEQQGAYEDRAAVFGDLENDGDIDIIIAQRDGPIRILRNNTNPIRNAQTITLKRDSLGAKILLRFEDGTSKATWCTDGVGFQSSSAVKKLSVHHNSRLEEVEVVWPDGTNEKFIVQPNRYDIILQR